MIVVSADLAARIERAECRLLRDACARVHLRLGDTVFAMPLAGGVAAFTEPGSPINKVAGLGFTGPPGEDALSAVEHAYETRGAPVQVEVATLADPAIVRALTARGYVLVGFEHVLGRALAEEERAARRDIRIEHSGAAELEAWIDVVVSGFASPDIEGVASHERYDRDVVGRVIRDFAQSAGVERYVAYRDGELAGGGSLRVHEGVAQLCGAATLPGHRRQGVQRALIETRLADAARAGCDVAVVTTQPGSTSQQNMQRLGFQLLYARAVLVRGGATAV